MSRFASRIPAARSLASRWSAKRTSTWPPAASASSAISVIWPGDETKVRERPVPSAALGALT
jgi:hypothetical protein